MILCYDAIMENERLLRQLARDITEDVLGHWQTVQPAIGMKMVHVKSGRPVVVTGGSYYGDYGISNFWEWRYDDGGGDIEHGHGYGYELSAQVEHPMLTTPNL